MIYIFTSSHLLTVTSAHIIFTSSHLHILSSHIIIESSHLHIYTYHLHIFASAHLHISSSHLHIFTSSHLILTSSLSLSPSHSLSISFFLSLLPSVTVYLLLFSFLSSGRGRCRRGATKWPPFARNEVRSSKTVVTPSKIVMCKCRRQPFRTK